MLTWLGIWVAVAVLAGLEIARIIDWGHPTPSEPEPARKPSAGFAGSFHPTADIVAEVLARGRRDGLNDVQLAGGIAVVLESHGLLQREPA